MMTLQTILYSHFENLNDEILSFETKTTKTGKDPELKRSH